MNGGQDRRDGGAPEVAAARTSAALLAGVGEGDGHDPGAGARRRPGRRFSAADRRALSVLVVLLVLTHRLGVPVGGTTVSLAIPVVYGVLVVLLLRGRLRFNRVRAELFTVGITGCVLVTAVAMWRGGDPSIPSLMLVLALYAPWVLGFAVDRGSEVVQHAARTYVRVMVVLAAVGVVQFVSQLVGLWEYEDLVKEFVPPELLVQGFNNSIPLVYGSSVYKSNAFVLLEPSFLSQYCALAVIAGLMVRVPAWQSLVLVAGLASAVSGTGIILLVVGLVIMLVRAPRRIGPGVVMSLATGLLLVLLSPVAPLLLDRTGEVSQPSSSGYGRFVAPYVETARGLDGDTWRYVIGAGPGTVERLLPSRADGIGNDVLYSVVPKLLFEYGLFVGGLFALFLVFGMLNGAPWRVVPGTLLVMTFVLSGGLLQPQTAYLAWVFTGLGVAERLRGP